jgi:hypothetical protein
MTAVIKEKKSEKKNNEKLVVLVGDPAWNDAEIGIESEGPQQTELTGKPPRQVLGHIGWALALGIALALLITGYAIAERDHELIRQVWEMSKYLISSIIIGRAIGTSRT